MPVTPRGWAQWYGDNERAGGPEEVGQAAVVLYSRLCRPGALCKQVNGASLAQRRKLRLKR